MKVILLLCSLFLPVPALARPINVGPIERPAQLTLPKAYDGQTKFPLILSLHGLGNPPELTDFYLGLSRNQDRYAYILLRPKGTIRPSDQKSFWNAFPACCDKDKTEVDDAKYLRDLVASVIQNYAVDPNEVYIYGYSNGGFMAHRLACDNDGLFTGVVSIAGALSSDPLLCTPTQPVNFLQIHGMDDATVFYDTTQKSVEYLGAKEAAAFWAKHNDCRESQEQANALNLVVLNWEIGPDADLNIGLRGQFKDFVTLNLKRETDTFAYSNCAEGTRVGLWSIKDASHAPIFMGQDVVGKSLRFLRGEKP